MMADGLLLVAEVFVAVLCAVLGYSVVTRKLVIAWPISIGVALFTLAGLAALDAMIADLPFLDRYSVAARWLLVVVGVAFIVGCFVWRIFGPQHGCPRRRMTDFVALSGLDDLGKSPPPPSPQRRPWYRWKGRR